MGFKAARRTYVLEFEAGTFMEGAEITIRSTPVATLVRLQDYKLLEWADELAKHIVKWNLEDADGKTIKITAEDILANLEEPIITAIVMHWVQAAKGLTAPLDPPSSDGNQSQEE